MTYREARCRFSEALAELILHARDLGYEAAFNEVMDRVTEKDPTTDHMPGSLHELGLAADLDLYKDGKYLSATEDHRVLGSWWIARGRNLGLPLAWGGEFTKPDGNHYSITWSGRR